MTLRDRFERLVDAARSYLIALKASGKYGRSIKLCRIGRCRAAAGRAEGSGIVCLTLQVERLAHELGEPGAGGGH